MKILNILLIVSLLVFVVTGCQKQANTPNTPAANTPVTVQTQAPAASDQAIDNNVTVGDNPDTGDVSVPSVDTSSLS